MKESIDNELEKVTGGVNRVNNYDINVIAKEAENNLDMLGQDRRIISEHRNIFDEEYKKGIQTGKTSQQAINEAIGIITLRIATE